MKMTRGLYLIARASCWCFILGATQNSAPLPPLTLASPPGLPTSGSGALLSYFPCQIPARILDLLLVLTVPYLRLEHHQVSHALLPTCAQIRLLSPLP